MKKTLFLLSVLCGSLSCSFGQNAAQYIFSTSTGPYTQITGGVSVAGIQIDDGNVSNIPIGFSFTFCGSPHTTLSACSNGWLSFGNSTSTVWTNTFANMAALTPVLMPFWDDLHGTSGTAWYLTTGTAPNRIFTFEWRNWQFFNQQTGGQISFQVKLFETSNVIHFIYRQEPIATNSITATIGIAKTGTDYQTLNNASAAPTPSSAIFTETISSKPATDQIYIWSPPLPCVGQPVAGTAVYTPGCPNTIALNGYTVATQLIFQWQKKALCDTGWTNIVGANAYSYNIPVIASPTDFRCSVTCTNGGLFDISNIVNVASVAPCYCASAATSALNEDITNVSVGSLNNSSTCATTGGPGSIANRYSNYGGVVPPVNIPKGVPTPFSITIGSCGTNNSNQTAIYIDYNQNGTFDAAELVSPPSGVNVGPNTFAGTFTLPSTANIGVTGMRVVCGSTLAACGTYTYGETEDYLVNILYAPAVVGDGVFCSGDTVTLTATAPGISGPYTFLWYGPGGFIGTAATIVLPNVQVPQTGIYTAYVVTYPCGGSTTDTSGPRAVNVWVNQTPQPPIVAPVITYCQYAVFDSIDIFGQNLKWYTVPVGGIASTVKPVVNTSTYSSATYYVSQTIAGCESGRSPVTINVVPQAPPPTVKTPTGYCQGDVSTPLEATGQNIRWYSVATGGVGTPIIPVPNTNAQGTFTWYATQTIDGCESSRVPVVVNISYRPNALILTDRPFVCQYDTMSIYYFGNATSSADYVWTLPTGASIQGGSNAGPLVIKFDTAGIQRVKLVVDNSGCIGPEAYVDVTVRLSPVMRLDLQKDACQDDIINISLAYSTVGIDHFDWDFMGGNIIYGSFTAGPYGVQWTTPGDKYITVIATDESCKSLPVIDTINVHPLPDAHIIGVSASDICSGDSVRLEVAYNPNYSYQWKPEKFFEASNEAIQWAVIDFTDEVTVQVTSNYNCKASDSILINAKPCCDIVLPNAFTPNNDNRNDIFRIITIGNHKLSVFKILNRWGQTVYETNNERAGWNGTFGGKPQDMGTYQYYIKYKCSDGNYYEKKGDFVLIR